jgi:hypothetical protein
MQTCLQCEEDDELEGSHPVGELVVKGHECLGTDTALARNAKA